MTFAGIDYSSVAIDVVRLELDSDEARWDRILLDPTGKLEALERARRVRELMPARSAWADDGVVTIALEDPRGPTFKGSIPLARVQGAILACLPGPGDVDVIALAPWEWKMACGLSGNAKKVLIREWVLRLWSLTNLPDRYTQDALDAYAIAWAARSLCEKAAAAA
jgi:Holliday junction resolvasome RuvABC endonuclease subunit